MSIRNIDVLLRSLQEDKPSEVPTPKPVPASETDAEGKPVVGKAKKTDGGGDAEHYDKEKTKSDYPYADPGKKPGAKKESDEISRIEALLRETDRPFAEEIGRKTYQSVAEILKPYANTPVGKEIAGELANYFASENPRFDRDKFLKAAGIRGRVEEPIAVPAEERK